MAAHHSKKAIYAALIGNTLIAFLKLSANRIFLVRHGDDQVELAISETERKVNSQYPAILGVLVDAKKWLCHVVDRISEKEPT